VLASQQAIGGSALIVFGVASIGAGVALLADRRALAGSAVIGLGVASIGLGVVLLADRQALAGAAVIGFGVASIAVGVAAIGPATITSGIRRVIDAAIKPPPDEPGPETRTVRH